jgi:CID domain
MGGVNGMNGVNNGMNGVNNGMNGVNNRMNGVNNGMMGGHMQRQHHGQYINGGSAHPVLASFPLFNFGSLRPDERVAANEYDAFLNTLTFNSKEIINNMTRVAADNLASVNAIASVIEHRIVAVPHPRKLPCLYLLDSISKNIGPVYVNRFRPGLYRCFVAAYDPADPQTRASMMRLLNTWPPVFGHEPVEAIRRHIAASGPAPAPGPSNIQQNVPATGSTIVAVKNPALDHIDRLAGALTRTIASGMAPSPLDCNTLSSLISVQLAQTNPPLPHPIRTKLLALHAQFAPLSGAGPAIGPHPQAVGNRMPGSMPRSMPLMLRQQQQSMLMPGFPGMPALPGIPNLAAVSIPRSAPPMPLVTAPHVLRFADLKSMSHADVVRSLYTELTFLSKSDGMRFRTQMALRAHMDWLFAQNKRKRARDRATGGSGVSRCWYDATPVFLGTATATDPGAAFSKTPLTLGAAFSSATTGHTRTGGTGQDTTDELDDTGGNGGMSSDVSCAAMGGDEVCPACCEGFQSSWDDDKQSWMLKDAVRSSEDGHAYHSGCYTSPDDSGFISGAEHEATKEEAAAIDSENEFDEQKALEGVQIAAPFTAARAVVAEASTVPIIETIIVTSAELDAKCDVKDEFCAPNDETVELVFKDDPSASQNAGVEFGAKEEPMVSDTLGTADLAAVLSDATTTADVPTELVFSSELEALAEPECDSHGSRTKRSVEVLLNESDGDQRAAAKRVRLSPLAD